MLILQSSFELVKNWLLSSGLRNSNHSSLHFGGVHSYYDEKNNEFEFLYPEITGYYLSMMQFLYEKEKNEIYLNNSEPSADWLAKIYEKYGGIIQGFINNSANEFSYSFDTSICAKGLLDYYQISKNNKYLNLSKNLISLITDQALDDDGTIRPFKKIDSSQFIEDNSVWYKQKGCFHIKNAMSFAQLSQITSEKKFLQNAENICNSIKQYQKSDGSIVLHRNNETINLHTLCYALEGLLYCYSINKNEQYLENCNKAIDWIINHVIKNGNVELWFNSKYKSRSSYPVAQLIRIMILLDKLQNHTKNKKFIDKLHSILLSFQVPQNSDNAGAFYEEYYKSVFGWKKRLRLNSWASMFSLQALFWYDMYDQLIFEKEIKYLY